MTSKQKISLVQEIFHRWRCRSLFRYDKQKVKFQRLYTVQNSLNRSYEFEHFQICYIV